MDKVRILVAEDDLVIATNIQLSLRSLGYDVVGVVESGEELLECINTQQPDLILLDINLKGQLSGIEVAAALQRLDKHVPFIFLSALSDKATINHAKLTEPAAYLVKPVEAANLQSAIEVALYNFAKSQKQGVHSSAETTPEQQQQESYLINDSIFFKVKKRFEKIRVADIIWIEAADIYATIQTEKEQYLVSHPLKVLEEKFPQDEFIRVHRSYIVRLNRIEAIEEDCLILGTKRIPIGKTYREVLLNKLKFL